MRNLTLTTVFLACLGLGGCELLLQGVTCPPAGKTDVQTTDTPPAGESGSQTTQPATQPAEKTRTITKIVETVDMFAPEVLALLGAIGVPGVGAIGLFWQKSRKLARHADELIEGAQSVKRALDGKRLKNGDGKRKPAKDIINAALTVAQSAETIAYVAKRKGRKARE